MRQWEIDPKLLCRKHLLGEHLEMHMYVGSINKGIDVSGYIKSGLLDIDKLPARHNALAAELISRGYKHKSPLRPLDPLMLVKYEFMPTNIDIQENLNDLSGRCEQCNARIRAAAGNTPD